MFDDVEFNENFNIDTGIDLDDVDNSGEFNGEDDGIFGASSNTQADEAVPQDYSKKINKTAIIGGIAGFIIIVIGLVIYSAASKSVNRTKQIENNHETTIENTVQNVVTSEKTNQTTYKNNNTVETSWKEFHQGNENEFDIEVNSNFTITSITHMAKMVNDKNDIMVKSIVKGNISGLLGTYEIEIPYSKARYLKEGTVFDITYNYCTVDGVKIIDEIRY